ncbi:MAG: ornithine cyclodeaminase family protein, partial [Pyrobaculum sp.]
HMEGVGIAVKLVGIYPKARPSVKAVVMVFHPDLGTPIALINGTQLTAWRTAAASGVAARALGARPKTIGLAGAGLQGEYHLKIFKSLYPEAEFKIFDMAGERAREVAARHNARFVPLSEVLKCDLVITATTSRTPVALGRELRSGAVVVSIGAPRPVRELDEETRQRAGCMLVDNPHAREESDDVAESWVYMGDFLKGVPCGFGEVKVYKSVGNPLFDVAMAGYVLEKAKKMGVGVEVVWE